jgi:malic enzyme
MGIPVGKLSLYCAAGGIAPHRVLPVVLDVGTNNETLLNDPFYLGVNQHRLRGDAYFYLVDEFMDAVRFRWPNVMVQFEDFSSDNAQTLLDKYRDEHLCFNDDIQGTGATTLAGLLCALRARGEEVTALGDQRIVITGAGSAGIGIAQVLKDAMIEQGKSEKDALKAFYVVDQQGYVLISLLLLSFLFVVVVDYFIYLDNNQNTLTQLLCDKPIVPILDYSVRKDWIN